MFFMTYLDIVVDYAIECIENKFDKSKINITTDIEQLTENRQPDT